MTNRWNENDEREYAARYANSQNSADSGLLQQAYATALLGADSELAMHGGGNTSVKGGSGEKRAMYVKASGIPLSAFTPEHFVAMDLNFLEGLRNTDRMDDDTMAGEFKKHRLSPDDRLPSIESLMHAFIPAKFVSHTHPAAILKIVNRAGGRELLKECFGSDLAAVPYASMGLDLAKAVSEAISSNAACKGVVIGHHGLVVWADDARAAYSQTVDMVTKAEEFLKTKTIRPIRPGPEVSAETSAKNYAVAAPVIRLCLSQLPRDLVKGGDDVPVDKIELALLNTPDVLELINSPDGENILTKPPMTPDYPMLTRILPLWADIDVDGQFEKTFLSMKFLIDKFTDEYKAYLDGRKTVNVTVADLLPQVIIIPSAGAVCFGINSAAAAQTADFARQAMAIRRAVYETGGEYECLPEQHLFDMQYRGYQQAKKGN